MAAEWWLIDEPTQGAIADRIDEAATSVIAHCDLHGNENSLTAALGQQLLATSVSMRGARVSFSYRNFLEQDEEPQTGADGGIIVAVQTAEEVVKKAVLFQAKRFPQHRPIMSLTLAPSEARRLQGQLNSMVNLTNESVVLAYTRRRVYSIDGRCAEELPLYKLQHITAMCRLVTLGTFLGKWVARCSRGELRPSIVNQVERPKGFLKHLIHVNVTTDQRPLLTEGGIQIDPLHYQGMVPKRRWES